MSAPSEPTYVPGQTAHLFTWSDGTSLELRDPVRDRQRRLWAEVLAYAGPDSLLNHKQLDVLNQISCDRFAAGAAAVDGAIAWGPRLLFAAHHVAITLDQQVVEQPPNLEPTVPWPVLDDAAYHGLPGQIVRVIEPHTESDPVAILVQLLTMAGNAIGRTPYFPVEADVHHVNLFVALVGATSKGRKGTSAGHPRRMLKTIDPAWDARVMGGMSSGEGIIWQVRDAVHGHNKQGEDVVIDAGISDKRLLVLETEFARGLAKMGQDGNVLSAVLRQAWDGTGLNTLVSGRQRAPVTATDAHVSICAHITVEELQRLLTDTDKANGLGNRFLWVAVQRSKLLPRGGTYPEQELQLLIRALSTAISHARTVTQMHRTPAAEKRWEALYAILAEPSPGLFGAIVARAEAQTLRLACLYALLDKTDKVDVPHLNAAYALWRYCEDSARYIFGTLLGDPLADDIYQMLRQMGSAGMTRTDISNGLARHHRSAALRVALNHLLRAKMARYVVEKTAGRPVEKWFVCEVRSSEISELSQTIDHLNSLISPIHTPDTKTAPSCEPQQRHQAPGHTSGNDSGEIIAPRATETADDGAAQMGAACPQCGGALFLELPTERRCAMCGTVTPRDAGASHV